MERATVEIHEEFDGLLKDRKRKFAYLRAVEEAFGDDRGAPVTIVEMGCAQHQTVARSTLRRSR
jgi:hypothetical protein